MPFGPFALQWRAPSPNPPLPSPLPVGITRSYIVTPSGPLELLSAIPEKQTGPSQLPLFFAHGGFGCAEIWLPYMQLFASHGIPCYAMSYRGHGKSWYPGFWSMYFTTRGVVAGDLVAGIRHVEEQEKKRRGAEQRVSVVLVAHSAGGALSQYVLSRGLVRVAGFCMLAAVPGFGSFSVYKFWASMVPFHFPYRLFHPRYVLATTPQIHAAFFTPGTPVSVVKSLQRLLAPYESMLWPMQTIFRFVNGGDVLSSIIGWGPPKSPTSLSTKHAEDIGRHPRNVPQRLLVLAAEHDVLCTPSILLDAAKTYRQAFQELVAQKKLDGISERDVRPEEEQGLEWDGVGFKVVPGLGHHLQNHVEWEVGAEEILRWMESL